MDIQQLKVRVYSLVADLDYHDTILEQKSKYETELWGLKTQKQLPDNQGILSVLEDAEAALSKKIAQCDQMLDEIRKKMLRALGRL